MSDPDKVTQDDIDMLQYYLIERGDIHRWSEWEKRKPVIGQHYPELISAIEANQTVYMMMFRVAKNIIEEFES